ncbi:MAG TPA: cation:proton antiporter [Conexibacter sp.]|nr:cation:proton antiporter [Conexibacter sp.]
MLLLAVATGLADNGGLDAGDLALVVGISLAFVAFFALVGTRVTQRWPRLLHAPRFAESPLLPAVLVCLGLAALAAEVGLAAVIGAFLAGPPERRDSRAGRPQGAFAPTASVRAPL